MAPSTPATRRKPAIAVAGHLCLDIIPAFGSSISGESFLVPGSLTLVEAPAIATGGAVGNVGIDLWRLGVPVELVARVGDDAFGALLRERLAREDPSLARGLHSASTAVTSYTIVLSPPGVDRLFLHCPGANDDFSPADVDDAVLEAVSTLHFGYPPLLARVVSDGGTQLADLFGRARAHGVVTSLDMTLPDPASAAGELDWEAFLARVLPETDLFLPSLVELLYMLDRGSYEQLRVRQRGGGADDVDFAALRAIGERVLMLGAGAALIKLGGRGLYLRTASGPFPRDWTHRELYCPAFRAREVVGTTGAGDAAVAGWLAGLLRQLPVEEALKMAAAVGACSVEAAEASSGVQPWEMTAERVRAGWTQEPTTPSSTGWCRQPNGVWCGPADAER